jgi:hypothetical protein
MNNFDKCVIGTANKGFTGGKCACSLTLLIECEKSWNI